MLRSLIHQFARPRVFSSFRYFHSTVTVKGTSVSVAEDGKKLNLWIDGEPERRYHSVWLKHNCQCPKCLSPFTDQVVVPVASLTFDTKITSAEVVDNVVYFTVESQSLGATHNGYCPTDWLKEFSYCNNERVKRRNDAEPIVASSLPTCDFKAIMETDEGLYKWLKQLNYYGVSLIQNMPANNGVIAKVAQRIGVIQNTIYGETFDVVTSETPINQAFSDDSLILHMDQGFYEAMPGLQLLHCIKNDKVVVGGESILLDAYPVVLEMREKYPKEFETLTRVPVSIQRVHYKRDDPADYQFERPTIALDRDGRIVAINWCPQLNGPLIVDEDEIEDYYKAFTLLSKMFDQSEFKLHHRLEPGEAITFNNRRVMHSRTKFSRNGGERYLEGVYINLDDFRSKFQTLAQQLGTGDRTKHLLNFSWSP